MAIINAQVIGMASAVHYVYREPFVMVEFDLKLEGEPSDGEAFGSSQ